MRGRSTRAVKDEKDDILPARRKDRTSRTSLKTSVEEESQESVSTSRKKMNTSKKRKTDCSSVSEDIVGKSDTCKEVVKSLTDSVSAEGKRNLKRKKGFDREKNETDGDLKNNIASEKCKTGSVNDDGKKSGEDCSKTRKNGKIKEETDVKNSESEDSDAVKNPEPEEGDDVENPESEESDDDKNQESEESDEKEKKTKSPAIEKVYTCGICDEMVIGTTNFAKHKKLFHFGPKRIKPYKCGYEGCSKCFVDSYVLRRHVEAVHLNIRNYLCEFCVARFKTLSSLKVHILCYHVKKEDVKEFKCKLCRKSFQRKINLKKHEKLHTNVKNFPCSFEGCDKSFRTKEGMSKHEKYVHKAVKPFPCKICGERFSRNIYLETHMYKHTGIKKFCCEVCGKFFSQKGNLRVHMLVHNNERPLFKCPDCFRTFTFKSNLTKHRQTKHGLGNLDIDNCTYQGASTYKNKNVEGFEDDEQVNEHISIEETMPRSENMRKFEKTVATRNKRKAFNSKRRTDSRQLVTEQKVFECPTSVSMDKRNSNNERNCVENLEQTDLDSSVYVIVTKQQKLETSDAIENYSRLSHVTSVKEDSSLIKGSGDASNDEEGSIGNRSIIDFDEENSNETDFEIEDTDIGSAVIIEPVKSGELEDAMTLAFSAENGQELQKELESDSPIMLEKLKEGQDLHVEVEKVASVPNVESDLNERNKINPLNDIVPFDIDALIVTVKDESQVHGENL